MVEWLVESEIGLSDWEDLWNEVGSQKSEVRACHAVRVGRDTGRRGCRHSMERGCPRPPEASRERGHPARNSGCFPSGTEGTTLFILLTIDCCGIEYDYENDYD